MEQNLSFGKQIKIARHQQKLSQEEFANKCNLNIRTIQRIENDLVTPRPYTLRIISDVLSINLSNKDDSEVDNECKQLTKLRNTFKKRKQIRIFTFIVIISLLFITLFLIFSGIPKRIWAPFIYIFFYIDFIIIGFTWRCPGCNSLLGDVFNLKYCSKCGLKFYD